MDQVSGRSELRRYPNRGSHEPEVIHKILDEGFLAHVGFNVNGQPFVIPTLYGRAGDRLYLHGSAASRMLKELDRGIPACVNVAVVDALVLARSGFHSSINYRSVVAFGTAKMIHNAEDKTAALETIRARDAFALAGDPRPIGKRTEGDRGSGVYDRGSLRENTERAAA